MKIRKPVPPPGGPHRNKRDYNRQAVKRETQQIIEGPLPDWCDCIRCVSKREIYRQERDGDLYKFWGPDCEDLEDLGDLADD